MLKLKYQDVFLRIIVTFLHVKIVITIQTDFLSLHLLFYEIDCKFSIKCVNPAILQNILITITFLLLEIYSWPMEGPRNQIYLLLIFAEKSVPC